MLLDIVNRKTMSFVLQDLQCKKCKQVNINKIFKLVRKCKHIFVTDQKRELVTVLLLRRRISTIANFDWTPSDIVDFRARWQEIRLVSSS